MMSIIGVLHVELGVSAAKNPTIVLIVALMEISSLMAVETVNASTHIIYRLIHANYVHKL